jgi:hypothetical protein
MKPLQFQEPFIIDKPTQVEVFLVDQNGNEQLVKTLNYIKGETEKNINFTFTRDGRYYLKVKYKTGTLVKESYSNQFIVATKLNQQIES